MKIAIYSDIHLEFFENEGWPLWIPPVLDVDLVVLAGDIYLGTRAIDWIQEHFLSLKTKVIYLCGNHEFYHHDFINVIADWREIAAKTPNLYFLENDQLTIDGQHFVGCTLWSDFNNADPKSMIKAKFQIADYRSIRRFTPAYSHGIHKESRQFLNQYIQPDSVVITHHLPSYQLVEMRYRDSVLTGSFASNLDNLILEKSPKLWIHGHSHSSCDLNIGSTRIVRNPRGYVPFDINKEFNDEFVIEI